VIKRTVSMMAVIAVALLGVAVRGAMAQGGAIPFPQAPAGDDAAPLITKRLNFIDAPLDIVLADYSEMTEKTLLRAPGLPAPTFTLRSQGELTVEEYLKAIETVLTMNGVGLVEFGDKFVRVVPVKSIRREGLDVLENMPEGGVAERGGTMVSQLVALKHIDIAEATKAIDPMRNENGQINPLERTNSMLITDLPENINRILQVLRLLDQPVEAREEPSIIQIRFSKAADIKKRLEEIIADSQKEQQASTVPRARASGAPGVVAPAPTGVIRPQSVNARSTSEEPEAAVIEAAERGIIKGKVLIVADERTNLLIIITRRENMAFFERIVAVLDVETSPDVEVKVIRLEFAIADEVAKMLNDLIGATQKEEGSAATPLAEGTGTAGTESRRLAEVEAALRNRQKEQQVEEGKSSIGKLSKDSIKILSDKRTNSLIIMASKSDQVAIQEIVKDMDMMLSQVLIEAVIIDVTLKDGLETGVSWIQKSMMAYTRDSSGARSPVFSFAGGGGGGAGTALDATRLNDPATLSTSGLGYFFTMFDLNVNMILKASASDDRTRVVSTPALLTTDNTEAVLTSTDLIYVYKGKNNQTYGSTSSVDFLYDQKEVGLTLKVKPQINANQVVMMKIEQEISEPGTDVAGTGTENLTGKTISSSRKIDASIAVKSGQTIVLGGQVRDSKSRVRSKIPLLGDIPLLGRLFNSDRRSSGRTETIVFITPYVLDTPEEVSRETQRRRDSLNIDGMWKKGWSGSELAEPGEPAKKTFPRESLPAKPDTSVPAEKPAEPVSSGTTPSPSAGNGAATGPVAAPVDPTLPVVDDEAFKDVDAFVVEQQKQWDETVRGNAP
jgi:general secretion pathway protein D